MNISESKTLSDIFPGWILEGLYNYQVIVVFATVDW